MKISELPHRDPAWAYIELKDGSLVALPKNAIKELLAENERLKKKIAAYEDERKCLSETITCDADVIINLNKENAKLKCLALHAMSQYYGYKSLFSSRKKTHRIKYGQFSNKFYEAYCRAKKALKEGK